jgi:4-amino-4-deoxy-L-arabinose transferase-like glycosyltransferase
MPSPAPPPDDRLAAPEGAPLGRGLALAGAAFLALVTLSLLLGGGVRPLEFEEPRRALVALEMLLRGDLLVPTTNGLPYLNKPPLFNWVLIGFMQLSGSTAGWLVRLPTVLSVLAMALLTAAAARRHLGRPAALAAGAMVLTFTTLLFYGTLYGEIDVFYALLVAAQALAIFAFEQEERPLLLFTASYLLAALGVLTKGLPSAVVQGLTLLVWLAQARKLRWLRSLAHLAGLGLFVLCVGGYLLAYAARGADPVQLLAKLLLEASERTAVDDRHRLGRILLQLVRFPADLAALCLPWVALAPALLLPAVRRRVRRTPLLWFSALFIGANALPYWLSPGNKPRYMFIFLPFAALLLAAAGQHLRELGRYARLVQWAAGGLLAAAALGCLALPFSPYARFLPGAPGLAGWLAVTAGMAALAVAFWRRRELRARLVIALLALAVARLAYDLVVPYVRREQGETGFYQGVVAALDRDFPQARILLAGTETLRTRRLPFLGRAVAFRETEWFNYTLSFYFTESRRELLRFATALEPGSLYLVHRTFPLDGRHEVVRTFGCPRGEREDLLLVRVAGAAP